MADHALMARAAAVWRALSVPEVYGTQFAAVYGPDPAPLWIEQIATLTNEQCRAACVEMAGRVKAGQKFPVNLTEFVAAAREGAPGPTNRPLAGSRPYESRPVASASTRDRTLASIRAKLGMGERRE